MLNISREKNLDREIDNEPWDQTLNSIRRVYINVRHKLIQHNYLHRTYLCPS